MLTSEYLAGLPKDRIQAADKICDDLFEVARKHGFFTVPRVANFSDADIRNVLAALEKLVAGQVPAPDSPIRYRPTSGLLAVLRGSTARQRRIARLEEIRRFVKAEIVVRLVDGDSSSDPFTVVFEGRDLKIINQLLGDIRSIIQDTKDLSEDHRTRLLGIAAAFQAEIDKPKSNFRVFLDGVLEASATLGEAGKKIKPAVDRLREILGMAEKRLNRTKRLDAPKEVKQLPPPRTTSEPEVDSEDL